MQWASFSFHLSNLSTMFWLIYGYIPRCHAVRLILKPYGLEATFFPQNHAPPFVFQLFELWAKILSRHFFYGRLNSLSILTKRPIHIGGFLQSLFHCKHSNSEQITSTFFSTIVMDPKMSQKHYLSSCLGLTKQTFEQKYAKPNNFTLNFRTMSSSSTISWVTLIFEDIKGIWRF